MFCFCFLLVCSWLVFSCHISWFSFCRKFCGKLLFHAISSIKSFFFFFFFLFGVNEGECFLVMWYPEAAILCLMGQFEKKTDAYIGGGRFVEYVNFKLSDYK